LPEESASRPGPLATDQPSRAILLMLLAVAMFSLLDATAKWLTRTYPVPMVIWARYVVSLILMLAALPWAGGLEGLRTRRPGLQSLRGILLLLCTVLFITAISYIPLATATAVGFVSPLFVTALSIPLLGERVGRRRWAAVLAGFLGVLVIVRPAGGAAHWASLLPIAMAVCYASYLILTRMLRLSDGAFASLFYPAAVGAAVSSLLVPHFWLTPSGPDLAIMLALGLFGGLGHYLLIQAFNRAPASMLAPFAYCQIIGAAVLGYTLFGDIPDLTTGVGAAIVVASGLYVWHREGLIRRRAAAPGG
jgi:drug/metabolite transporter (DMT)-like permease